MSLSTLDVDSKLIGELLQLPDTVEVRGLSLVDRIGGGDMVLRLFLESPNHDGPLTAIYERASCGHAELKALQAVG